MSSYKTCCLPPDAAGIARAAEALRQGEVVGMPTETVYGLAANALDREAVLKIFAAKGRPADNPLIVHISSLEQIASLVTEFSPTAQKLADAFWPGPLTMILPKSAQVPDETSGGLTTVGIRMPSHPVARRLIEACGLPLAAPSANTSGKPSPTTAAHVLHDMNGRIPYIVDGGACGVGVESTVVLVEDDGVRVLRPGQISPADFERVVSRVTVDKGVLECVAEDAKVASPGMKYQHYAPGARVTMVEGALWEFWQYVEQHRDGSTAVLAFEEDRPFFDLPFFRYGHENDPDSQAEELFDALRAIDEAGVQTVYARMPAMDGVGLAVYNRLLRACAFSVVHLKPTMRVLGVTGPTGSGKGLVSAEAKRCGLGVVDCDRIAHELHRDPTVCQALAEAFGSQVLQEDGTVNRPALAKAAFADEDAHRRLNERMLPAILRRTLRALQDYARDGLPAVLLDAPTLLESGFAPICHQVAAVLAPQEVRLARIIARDGITEEAAVARMSVQPPEEYYRSHADVVLENNRSCEAFLKKAGDWLHDAAEAKKEG